MSVLDHRAEPVSALDSPTGLRCGVEDCGRIVAMYAGTSQHRRGTSSKAVTRAEAVAMLPGRLEAVERHLEGLLAGQAALAVQVIDLTREIRAWTSRQPVYVEMRPAHHRVADGGEGGKRERQRLRRIGGPDTEGAA